MQHRSEKRAALKSWGKQWLLTCKSRSKPNRARGVTARCLRRRLHRTQMRDRGEIRDESSRFFSLHCDRSKRNVDWAWRGMGQKLQTLSSKKKKNLDGFHTKRWRCDARGLHHLILSHSQSQEVEQVKQSKDMWMLSYSMVTGSNPTDKND